MPPMMLNGAKKSFFMADTVYPWRGVPHLDLRQPPGCWNWQTEGP
jgi:hypothetical protein